MPRRSTALWTAAILTAIAPAACFMIIALLSGGAGDSFSYGFVTYGWCAGYEADLQIRRLLGPIHTFSLPYFGSVPLIVLAWGGMLLSKRVGRPRIGRILARSVATVMIVEYLSSPLLLMLDVSRSSGCAQVWGPPEVVGWSVAANLYYLVPAILVLVVVRTPGLPRRSHLARTGATLSLVAVIVLGTVADSAASPVSDVMALGCQGFGEGTASGFDESEKEFLCAIRSDRLGEGVPELADMPDRDLLAYGRRLCDLAAQNEGNVSAPAVSKAIGKMNNPSLTGALA
ncbi:hypothetical protein, partial [Streptosporangium carneum]